MRNTQFNEFKTRNGRKVQDGGGVLPDLIIDELNTNSLTKALEQNNVIFDFATNYHYQNTIENLGEISFSENDFNDFKTFVSQSDFSYETKSEKAIKEAMGNEDSDVLGVAVQENYKTLLSEIEKSKFLALDKYRKEIQKKLEDEIVKRYFYREGLFEFYLTHDEAILAATELLSNEGKYRGILQ